VQKVKRRFRQTHSREGKASAYKKLGRMEVIRHAPVKAWRNPMNKRAREASRMSVVHAKTRKTQTLASRLTDRLFGLVRSISTSMSRSPTQSPSQFGAVVHQEIEKQLTAESSPPKRRLLGLNRPTG
jgi:hypothetical protein